MFTGQWTDQRNVGDDHDQSTSLSLSHLATTDRPAPTKPMVLASLHHWGLRSSAKETSRLDFTDASFRASAGSTGFGSAACLSCSSMRCGCFMSSMEIGEWQ